MVRSLLGALLFISLAFSGTILKAQVVGSIGGVVTDSTQAVVPGATVTVTNTQTGISRQTSTDAEGRYTFSALAPAPYDISASLAGFRTTIRQGVTVTVGSDAAINLVLEVGTVAEEVTVTGEAPLIDTRSAAVAGVVEERTIREIPLNGRSFSNLMALEPGVIFTRAGRRTTTGGTGEKMSLGGARPQQMSFTLDGADMMGKDGTTPAGASGNMLGVDTIQEFRVSTSAFSAEYGRSAGGVVSAITKSGTNEFHRTIFGFLRNDNVDAARWEDNRSGGGKPEFKRNQFGFTLGGPIAENRTFFFGSYEGLRDRTGTTEAGRVPTETARMDGSADGVPEINANVRPYLSIYPMPNGRDLGGGVAEYFFPGQETTDQNDFLIKLDHQLSDNDSITGRVYFDDGSQGFSTANLGLVENIQDSRIQSYLINHKKIFGATMVNDFRAIYTRTRLTVDSIPDSSLEALEFIPGRGFGTLRAGGGISNISTGGTNPAFWTQNIFEFIDDFALTFGSHNLKLGGIAKRIRFNGFSAARFRGQYDFLSVQHFLTGNVRQFETADVFASTRGLRQWLAGMYIQDEWRATPQLTLNLGLRYEFVTSPIEVAGRIANLRNQLDPDVIVGNPYFLNPSLKNFAPRFGIAYDPTGNGNTSIRSGIGIFYDQLTQLNYRVGAFRVLPFQKRFAVRSTSLPEGFDSIPFPNAGDFFLNQGQVTHDPNVQIDLANWNPHQPYAVQYNLTVQRQLGQDLSLMVGYLGSFTRNNTRNINWNSSLPAAIVNGDKCWAVRNSPCANGTTRTSLPRRNPNFSSVLQRMHDSNGNYNSLQLQVRKRYSSGLDLNFVYQYSKTMDEISAIGGSTDFEGVTSFTMDPEDRGRDYGRSSFDIRNYLTVSGSYELPTFGLNGVAESVLGGWRLTGLFNYSSGEPFTVNNRFDRASNNVRIFGFQERPNLAPGASPNPTSGTTAGCTFGRRSIPAGRELGTPEFWYDPCAFELQPAGMMGNLGRNTVQGPDSITMDLAVLKNIPVSEGHSLEFRWELFNMFNRPNFATPVKELFRTGTSFNATAVGGAQITRTRGTARQMQFALKYIF